MSLDRARRSLLCRIALLLLLGGAATGGPRPAAFAAPAVVQETLQRLWVYVGTYGGNSKGIYLGKLDLQTGELSVMAVAAKSTIPSFLALHPTLPFLYAVNEVDNVTGFKSGTVSAFAI